MSNIKDKEYLTFCNTTNLEWQFTNLIQKTNTIIDKNGREREENIYYKLHELLSPDKFIRKYDDGRTEDVYKSVNQMRNSAGILMNYLEEYQAGNDEAKFLEKWEVVYGADSYKLITEELIDRLIDATGVKIEYPKREEIEKGENTLFYLDVIVRLIDGTMDIIGGKESVPKSVDDLPIKVNPLETMKKKLTANITEDFMESIEILTYIDKVYQLYHSKDKSECISNGRKLLHAELKKGTESFTDKINEKYQMDLDYLIKLTRKINFLESPNFKVVILKKGNEIVVSIGNSLSAEGKTLPKEMDLLQILIDKIKREYNTNSYSVTFTGYNNGANFGVLSNFMLNEKYKGVYFYTANSSRLKDYIEFTEYDYSEKFESFYEVSVAVWKGSFKSFSLTTFFYIMAYSNLYSLGIMGIVTVLESAVDCIYGYLKTFGIKADYNYLKKMGYIKDLKIPTDIKGYITDKIYNKSYITLVAQGKYEEEIKVKTSDAVFLNMVKQNNLIIKPDYIVDPKHYENYRYQKNEVDYFVGEVAVIIGETNEYVESYIRLVKKNEIYEIEGSYIINKTDALYQPLRGLRSFTKEKREYFETMIETMQILGGLQRNWEKSQTKNLTIFSLNNKNIKKTHNIKIIKPTLEKGLFKTNVNEHIFLPYIAKDGNIGDKLRKEYIRNAFKNAVETVIEHKAYNFKKQELYKNLYEALGKYGTLRENSLKANNTNYGNKSVILPIYFYSKLLEKKAEYYKDFYIIQNSMSNQNETNILLYLESSDMKYAYNPKTALNKIKYDFYIPTDIATNTVKFKDILNTILPELDFSSKDVYVNCDIKALDKHIQIIGNSKSLNYTDKENNHGYVTFKCEKKKFAQNYDPKVTENIFGGTTLEKGKAETHMGCDFSYGRTNPLCCSHPRVYSPVNGVIIESLNGRVTIENTENVKTFAGEKINIPYYHTIEHLHEINVEVKVGNKIEKGKVIGTMGGTDFYSGNKFKYLQHVHYGIMINNRYYTGSLHYSSNKKGGNLTEFDRFIDPEDFWNKGLETGLEDFDVKKIGGAQ